MTAGRTCYHCKQWIAEGEPHDCWSTTEQALTHDLPEDLREAWERLRETFADFGEQRIYASHHSIMFARAACYAFVRPRATRLEVCFFLGRQVSSPAVRRAMASSRVKVAHIVHVRHRDEVEAPLTDWLAEAYEVCDSLSRRQLPSAATPPVRRPSKATAARTRTAKAMAAKAMTAKATAAKPTAATPTTAKPTTAKTTRRRS